MKLPFSLATLLLLSASGLPAQEPVSDRLQFSLERTGAAAQHYSLELDKATGTGNYISSPAPGIAAATAGSATATGAPLHVSAEVLRKVFAAAPLVQSNHCASRRKGIAQTGTKTLRLTQAGAEFSCTYNYSDEERVNTATAVFEALAETLQIGDRLAAKLRFDRLGLDAELETLQAELAAGRALEVGNIAPVLQALENDDRVMERVRRRAAQLLEGAGTAAQSAESPAIRAR